MFAVAPARRGDDRAGSSLDDMADLRREIEGAVEEIAYAAIGFAVLGIQRAQVARRQLGICDPLAFAAARWRAVANPTVQVEPDPGEGGDSSEP